MPCISKENDENVKRHLLIPKSLVWHIINARAAEKKENRLNKRINVKKIPCEAGNVIINPYSK